MNTVRIILHLHAYTPLQDPPDYAEEEDDILPDFGDGDEAISATTRPDNFKAKSHAAAYCTRSICI